MGRTQEQRWNLLGAGQDSYAGQNAQDPKTSRRIQSWIPQDDGQLHRELPEPVYASNTVSGPIVGLYEFDQNDGHGHVNRYYFCAARTSSTVGVKNCNFYSLVAGAWAVVSTVGVLGDAPMCVTQENDFFLADGTSNWLFNGTIWTPCGINFPLNPPAMTPNTGSAQVYFDSSNVTAYFFPIDNGQFHGTVGINYPTLPASAAATATNTSLLFNPASAPGASHAIPLQWATLSTTGAITGYTSPWSGAVPPFQMAVVCNLVIPVPGSYNITFQHDDGAFFGMGTGIQSGNQPVCTSGGPVNVYQSQTAIKGNTVLAGTSKQGVWSETFAVRFDVADTYPLEIDFAKSENAGMYLVFQIAPVTPNGPIPNPNPLPQSAANSGSITGSLGRYYWFTNADQTNGVATESSSSPIGVISGPITGGTVKVYQQPGIFTCSTTSTLVQGFNAADGSLPVSPDLNGTMVGQVVYMNGSLAGTIGSVGAGVTLTLSAVTSPVQTVLANSGVLQLCTYTGLITGGKNNALAGTIQTIGGFANSGNNLTNAVVYASTPSTLVIPNPSGVAEAHAATAQSPANSLNLVANSLVTVATNGRAVICDARCTHWNVYASESDGSKIGQYLFSVPVTQNLATTPYVDSSSFLDNPTNTFLPIFRPVRNDPPFGSRILTVHKTRQFRRQESSPNFFAFTANEEVTSGNNGDPAQCLPGSNINTVSDMVNVISYPDQSARLRGLVPHLDSLYMFSEKQCYPLYGNSVDDFAISQSVAFALGLAGRFAAKSTTNGLMFTSYDRRAFLYPTSLYSSYLAQGGAAASALMEVGKPIRNILKLIPASRLDEVVCEWYHFGIRDWWVLCFPTSATNDTPQTWVYDFAGKGWFQLQRGFSSVAVLEVSEGALVLIGGGVDGNTYVIDDQTGTYSTPGNLPASTWRPALIDFGDSESAHVFRRLELEFDSAALAQATQLTVWLDPLNADSPGQGRTLHLKPALGANRYSAFLTDQGGAVCQRMLLQVYVPANTISGVIRGIKLIADTAPGFITGSNHLGGV